MSMEFCNCEHAQFFREALMNARDYLINGDSRELVLEYICTTLRLDKDAQKEYEELDG